MDTQDNGNSNQDSAREVEETTERTETTTERRETEVPAEDVDNGSGSDEGDLADDFGPNDDEDTEA